MRRLAPILIPDDLYGRLKDENRKSGAPVAEIIRRALNAAFPGPEDEDEPNLKTEMRAIDKSEAKL